MLVAHDYLELLTADAVGSIPTVVNFLHDLGILNHFPKLTEHCRTDPAFLADHSVILEIAVVGIAEPAIWAELKLKKFVPKHALVTDIVADVKLVKLRRDRSETWSVGQVWQVRFSCFETFCIWIPDVGRFSETKQLGDRGSFKTPTLREIARTAPYMHDGSLKTLEDVVEFYNKGGLANPQLDEELFALKLTAEQKADLVTFLKEGLSSEDYPDVKPPTLPK